MSTVDFDGMFGMDLDAMIEHGGANVPALPAACESHGGEKRQLSVSALFSDEPSGFFASLADGLCSPNPLTILESPAASRAVVPEHFGGSDQNGGVLLPSDATAADADADADADATAAAAADAQSESDISNSGSDCDSDSDGDWSASHELAPAPAARNTRTRRARQAAAAASAAAAAAIASSAASAPAHSLSAYADVATVPFVATNNKRALDAKWSEELLEMEQNEFRTFCRRSNLSKKELQQLKQARRRAKNRAYAKASRARRLTKERRQQDEHVVARSEYEALQRECDQLRARNAELLAMQQQLMALAQRGLQQQMAAAAMSDDQ